MTQRKKVFTLGIVLMFIVTAVIGNISWTLATNKTAGLMLEEASVKESGVISEWDETFYHKKSLYAFLGGNVAYCLNYSLRANGGQSMKGSSTASTSLSGSKEALLKYAMYFGYSNTKSSTPNDTQKNQYIATQAIVWNITEGIFDTQAANKAAKKLCKTAPNGDASYSYYEKVRDQISRAYNNEKPSFAKKEKSKCSTYTLKWNEKNNRYETVLTDDKGKLDNYTVSLNGYSTEKTGKKLTIYSKKAISGAKTATLKSVDQVVSVDNSTLTYWSNHTSGYQEFVSDKPSVSKCAYYFKVKTQPKEDLVKENMNQIPVIEKASLSIQKMGQALTGYEAEKFTYDTVGLAGAEFELSAAEDIIYNNEIIAKKGTVIEKFVSDEAGMAKSTSLCPGTYTVTEIAAPEGYVGSKESLVISLAAGENKSLTVENERQKVEMSIKKTDAKTGCALAGAKFGLFAESDLQDHNGNIIVKEGSLLETEVSDADGMVHFTKDYPVASYVAKEIEAPQGYTYNSTTIEFDTEKSEQETTVIMMEKEFTNCPVGALCVYKVGEVLDSVKKIEKPELHHEFSYKVVSLAGITFDVYTAEDLTFANPNYSKGAKVGSVTTDENGCATLEELPLGKYLVKETTTLPGYVLDTEEKMIELKKSGQTTEVETESLEVLNKKQKVNISVKKESSEDGSALQGAVFAIYSKEDIVNSKQELLVKAGTKLAVSTTDEDGKTSFDENLPNGNYYVVEEKAPAGYVNANEQKDISAEFDGAAGPILYKDLTYKNQPIVVDFTKTDITGENELVGATLSVFTKDKKLVETWVSESTPHRIVGLPAGEYILREETAPFGYVVANDINFTVTEQASVQACMMKDEQVKGQILIYKTDDTGTKYLQGAEFTVVNEEGEILETFVSDKKGIAKSSYLPAAKFENGVYVSDYQYYVYESKAPAGYILDETRYPLTFTYVDDRTPVLIQKATIQNKPDQETMLDENEDMPSAPSQQQASTGTKHKAKSVVQKYLSLSDVKTGDYTNVRNWIAIAGCALLGMLLLFVTNRSTKKKK